ncbi:MAG: hypothetical protein ACO4AU_00435 [bacterium]
MRARFILCLTLSGILLLAGAPSPSAQVPPAFGTVNPPLNYDRLRQRVEADPAYGRLKKALATMDNSSKSSFFSTEPDVLDYDKIQKHVEERRKFPPPIKTRMKTIYPEKPR